MDTLIPKAIIKVYEIKKAILKKKIFMSFIIDDYYWCDKIFKWKTSWKK